jgi:hypothetical protein
VLTYVEGKVGGGGGRMGQRQEHMRYACQEASHICREACVWRPSGGDSKWCACAWATTLVCTFCASQLLLQPVPKCHHLPSLLPVPA